MVDICIVRVDMKRRVGAGALAFVAEARHICWVSIRMSRRATMSIVPIYNEKNKHHPPGRRRNGQTCTYLPKYHTTSCVNIADVPPPPMVSFISVVRQMLLIRLIAPSAWRTLAACTCRSSRYMLLSTAVAFGPTRRTCSVRLHTLRRGGQANDIWL